MTKERGFSKGFLGRLRQDQRGNSLMMVAAGLVPLLGLIGGGVDMSRIYLTKARLQQACDAGALAGRKAMGGGSWSANSNRANTTALNMFNANFLDGAYGSTGLAKSFAENAGKVSGTASVVLPMAVMKIFGFINKPLAVTCEAEMRIPNTDVMFVLDTTGSMGSKAVSTDTLTKIQGLKQAVKCFYEALAKVDTNANCGSTPSGGNSTAVQLRFGFVPYSTNVNVGKLLNNAWMTDTWTYQSREANRYAPVTTTTSLPGLATFSKLSSCQNWANANSASTSTMPTTGVPPLAFTTTNTTYAYVSYDSITDTCVRSVTTATTVYTANSNGSFNLWNYKPVAFNVSALKAGGSTWNSTLQMPLGTLGANTTVTWDGCIEERQPWQNTDGDPSNDYSPIPSSAYDMDIDMVPSSGNPATQWKPLLDEAVWGRYDADGDWSYPNVLTTSDLSRNFSYSCPTAARKLTSYPTATSFQNYVDSLAASGNTYHDIGLTWGARLESPTGLFASENAFTPAGGVIERHMIFMTDGDTVTSNQGYIPHGVSWWDRRQTKTSTAPSNSLLDSTVNARTAALCTAIKNKNITLWVISFGAGVSNAAQTLLQTCASPGRFYSAADSNELIENFKDIADEISQLRLTN